MTDDEINESIAKDPAAYSPPNDELMAIKEELREHLDPAVPMQMQDLRVPLQAIFWPAVRSNVFVVETLCMMLTDMEFAASAYRKAMMDRILTLGGTYDDQTK
jgi:hypothetical protein